MRCATIYGRQIPSKHAIQIVKNFDSAGRKINTIYHLLIFFLQGKKQNNIELYDLFCLFLNRYIRFKQNIGIKIKGDK